MAAPSILVVFPLTLSLRASRAARQSPVADWQEVDISTLVMGKKTQTTQCPKKYDSPDRAGCSNIEFNFTSKATLLQIRPD